MIERRAHVRVATKVDIIYSKSNSKEEEKSSYTKDISKGGMCLVLSEEVKESEMLDLKINLPTEEAPITVTGKVVWIHKFIFEEPPKERGFFAGIQFVDIDDEAGKKIDGFISTIV